MLNPIFEPKLGRPKDLALSALLPRYRRKVQLSRLPIEKQIVLPYLLLSDDAKLAFVKNSKAGCTSVAHLIHQYSKGYEYSGNIHKDSKELQQGLLFWKENLQIIQTRSPYLFSFVRHPEKRIVSAFLNFFIDRTNPTGKKHFVAMNAFGFRQDEDIQQNFGVFLNYIQASVDRDIHQTDRHWRPQYINLGIPNFQYDHIGKLENFEAEIEFIFRAAGIVDFNLGTLDTRARNSTQPNHLQVSVEHKKQIAAIYHEDYRLFDYSADADR
jgi:hypothetical protein